MIFSWVTEDDVFLVTWVFTLVASVHEFALPRSQTMKLFPGVSTRTNCSLAQNEILMHEVIGLVLLQTVCCTPSAEDPELTEEQSDQDGQDGELDARVLPPLYSSADHHFRNWEDVVWDSFVYNYEDHPVTRRDGSGIIAVELAALHHELAVDPLRWFSDFAMEKIGIRRMPYTRSCRG